MVKPLALTLGEPAGIGPDIAIKAWLRRDELKLPAFYLLGDRDFIARRASILGLDVDLADVGAQQAVSAFASALPVVATGRVATAQPGRPDETSAEAALASIRHAVADVTSGHASAVVTNPIAKSVLYRAGFRHPGHTEFLAELAASGGRAPQPVMMLWSPVLAVVPVTIHLPLRDAVTTLSRDLIVTTARIVVADLKARFGLAARKAYDCAICMYHDQALIPIKTIAFDDAVNVTLGLPFIRTSPDHGTAFDIAGTGRANPSSLIASLRLAARMAARSA